MKIKTGYELQLLSLEKMNLLESSKEDVAQYENGENLANLESVEVGLVHSNFINNNYQKASKVSLTFIADKQFGQLITVASH